MQSHAWLIHLLYTVSSWPQGWCMDCLYLTLQGLTKNRNPHVILRPSDTMQRQIPYHTRMLDVPTGWELWNTWKIKEKQERHILYGLKGSRHKAETSQPATEMWPSFNLITAAPLIPEGTQESPVFWGGWSGEGEEEWIWNQKTEKFKVIPLTLPPHLLPFILLSAPGRAWNSLHSPG